MNKFNCGHPKTKENSVWVKKGKGKGRARKCRTCVNARHRNYRESHRPAMRLKQNQYGKTHYAKFPEQICGDQKEYRQKLRNIVLDHYGGKCACCGETIQEFLCVDHINGGGNKHRKEIGTGAGVTFYNWLIKNDFPDGFQLLCYNCNSAKSLYGICPHKLIGQS